MSNSLSAILRSARPRAALITTYTLSLSYFEASILSALRLSGCRDIVLMVDKQESLASLAESRALGAGRTYRLLPVVSPGGGFFHPKIAYFECERDDILVVGSGNLTFSGQGGNLECLDAVQCSEHPGVFEEFAEWSETLCKKIGDSHPQAAAHLAAFAQTARSSAERFATDKPRTAWLVHSVEEPVATQFVRIASGLDDWSLLRVLSPFHAPNGSTVLDVAEAVGVTELEIGINPRTCAVALDSDKFKPSLPVTYVVPDTGEESPRDLHAKWFELLGKSYVLAMTGSVNATPQSMQSTKNVEISLIRLLNESPVEWNEATPSAFEPSEYTPPGPTTISFTLDAQHLPTSRIFIQLHKKVPAQAVSVELHCAGQILQAWEDVELSVDGQLRTPYCDLSSVVLAVSVQVASEGFRAAGWLNVETKLNGGELQDEHQAALNRLADGRRLLSDKLAFLQMLTQFTRTDISPPPVAQPTPAGISKTTAETPEKAARFSYSNWLKSGRHGQTSGYDISHQRLAKSIATLFNLNPSTSSNNDKRPIRKLLDNNQTRDDKDAPDESEGSSDATEAWLFSLERTLRNEIPRVLRENIRHAYAPQLAMYLLGDAIAHSKLVGSKVSINDAYTACRNWLQLNGSLPHTVETREALLPLAIAVAAWVAYQYDQADASPPFELLSSPLHQMAENGSLDFANATELATFAFNQAPLEGFSESEKEGALTMIYGNVFPGINNVVQYIRVYSALCWQISLVEEYLKDAKLTAQEARDAYSTAMEKIQLLITWVNLPYNVPNLVGTNRSYPTDNRSVELVFASFGTSRAAYLEAVQYRPSLTNGLEFAEIRSHGILGNTAAGKALAKAFDQHVRTKPGYDWLSDISALHATPARVVNLNQALNLTSPSTAERRAFLEQYFPKERPANLDSSQAHRWASLVLVLRVIAVLENEGYHASDTSVRIGMARGRGYDDTIVDISGVKLEQQWWAVLQVRQLHRLAMDTLEVVLEHYLDICVHNRLPRDIASVCVNLGKQLDQHLGDAAMKRLDDHVAGIKEIQGGHDCLYHVPYGKLNDDVFELIKPLMYDVQANPDGTFPILVDAFKALVTCAVEARNLHANEYAQEAVESDPGESSLAELAESAAQFGSKTAGEWLAYLVQHWVINRHFEIAAFRSRNGDGKNRFRFVMGDSGLQRYDMTQRPSVTTMAQDRLRQALRLLRQAGLLELQKDGEVEGYVLTEEGRLRLDNASDARQNFNSGAEMTQSAQARQKNETDR